MDRVTKEDLTRLLQMSGDYFASLYMPTVRSGDLVDTNPIRFKNLVQELERQMLESGVRANDVEAYLKPLRDEFERRFWQFQSDGLAIFYTPGFIAFYRVPIAFEELVVLTDRFHLKPILRMLSEDGVFYLLALSQGAVKLYHCSHWSIEQVQVEGLPAGIDETLMYDYQQKTVRGQEGAGLPTAQSYHSGRAADPRTDNQKRFMHDIDRALASHFRNPNTLLVLAAVDYLVPVYREINEAAHILDGHVSGNPDRVKPKDLLERVWTVAGPYFSRTQEKARERFFELKGTGRASNDLKDVVPWSYQGRIDTLFVAEDDSAWGFYDPVKGQLRVRGERRPLDADLLNFAAVNTVANGGFVYTVPKRLMPGKGSVAAIFRF